MASLRDKAAKAKEKAMEAKYYSGDSRAIASKIAKTATGKDLTPVQERRAGKIIQNRRTLDTGKAAMRGAFQANRATAKTAKAKMEAAVSGGPAPKKKVSPGVVAAAKKAAAGMKKPVKKAKK